MDAADKAPERPAGEALRVLVAHQTGPELRLIRETLKTFTYVEVDTTPNAIYAYELALQRPYKLFFFSLDLPVLPGETLYELICKAYHYGYGAPRMAPAVIFLGDQHQVRHAATLERDARVRGLLGRPVNPDRLLDIVGNVLPPRNPV